LLNLKNSDQVEKSVLLKLINNPELHEEYIPRILSGTFAKPEHRMIIFAIKQLYQKKINITAKNILLYISKESEAYAFAHKYKYDFSDLNVFEQIISTGLETGEYSTELFEDFYKLHLQVAFRRFVDKQVKSIRYCNDHHLNGAYSVVENAKAVIQLYEKFFNNQSAIQTGNIKSSARQINRGSSFYPTWSQNINSIMYGWSKGYPASILARSGHGKSTFVTNEVRHKIRKNIVDKVAIISTEEEESVFWQRMFALECGLSLAGMRRGLIKVSDSQITAVEKMYEGRISFYHEINYGRIIQLMYSLSDTQLIIFDHLNAIDYPGRGNSLQNMPGGIAKLITQEKKFLKANPESATININQVKEKDMPAMRSHWKCPSYEMAFGSTTTYFAAREWLALYYPYKDMVNRPHEWLKVKAKPDITDLHFEIQKSSFSEIGKGKFYWAGDLAIMEDIKRKPSTELIAPQEDINFEEVIKNLEKN